MLKRLFRVSVALSYVSLANYCLICAVSAQAASPDGGPGHCPTSAAKDSCCDGSTPDDRTGSDQACSFSMDDSSAIFKTHDVSVKPALVRVDALDAVYSEPTSRTKIVATRNHGPPVPPFATGFNFPPLQGRSPPALA